jgi:formylglycine-generating enzyme required for sulfatase activity
VEIINLDKDVKLEMVLIPAGKFMMGFTKKELADLKVEFQKELNNELGKASVELFMIFQGKQHEVTLTKPFYMGKYEVTQEQWESVMGKNPSDTKGAKLPVKDVSWEDCQEFIKKLNKKTDGGYRLPTEAEWEYACRAGTTTAYSFGDKITPKDANYHDSKLQKPESEQVTSVVGSYKPNAFGLYDMHGNVWEWCEDRFGDYPRGSVTNPKGPSTGVYTGDFVHRVLRGGSFNHNVSLSRSSYRSDEPTVIYKLQVGVRLARTP